MPAKDDLVFEPTDDTWLDSWNDPAVVDAALAEAGELDPALLIALTPDLAPAA